MMRFRLLSIRRLRVHSLLDSAAFTDQHNIMGVEYHAFGTQAMANILPVKYDCFIKLQQHTPCFGVSLIS